MTGMGDERVELRRRIAFAIHGETKDGGVSFSEISGARFDQADRVLAALDAAGEGQEAGEGEKRGWKRATKELRKAEAQRRKRRGVEANLARLSTLIERVLASGLDSHLEVEMRGELANLAHHAAKEAEPND